MNCKQQSKQQSKQKSKQTVNKRVNIMKKYHNKEKKRKRYKL